ncbi:MAG: hypothetical protein LBB47_01160 [Spirochaetaceae bacterium]|nr:hypothetical protein [Spirochaetaceae bacterium]
MDTDREQDLADLCEKWKAVLSDSAQLTAYGWEQAEVTAVLAAIDAFLAARAAYEADDSSAKRLVKNEAKDEAIDAMRDFANTSVRHNKKIPDSVKLSLDVRLWDTTPYIFYKRMPLLRAETAGLDVFRSGDFRRQA